MTETNTNLVSACQYMLNNYILILIISIAMT